MEAKVKMKTKFSSPTKPREAGRTLSVEFTPTDTANYNNASATVTINVMPANSDTASSVATVTSATYTVSAGGTATETITNVPFGTTKATFLAALIKGEPNQTWVDTGIADPVVTDDTLMVTAQDGTTVVTYTVDVVAAASPTLDTTPPIITLLGDNPVNLYVDDPYTDAGATASDNVDGDITTKIDVVNPVKTDTAGIYTITYNVSDAAGNKATEVTRTVNVNPVAPTSDTTAPVITLNGVSPMSLTVGDTFTDPGATAFDAIDGSVAVITSGSVDTSIVGTYTITYTATDAALNVATATRTVNVQ